MEFILIGSQDDFRTSEIYSSYSNAFPEDERRSETQFYKLFSNKDARVFSILNDERKSIGYLIAWELSHFTFLEHFEIFSQFRNQNYGSEVLKKLFQTYSKVILESEPADLNEMAARRIDFYTRNGMQIIDENYQQPAYSQDKNPVNLWLLANHQPENIDFAKTEIFDVVYYNH